MKKLIVPVLILSLQGCISVCYNPFMEKSHCIGAKSEHMDAGNSNFCKWYEVW